MSVMFGDYEGGLDPSKSKDRVIINVGGIRHECYISTIQNFPDTRLYWIAETTLKMADFDPDGNEFFFDRHPQCFANILNYCRTGKLHCPNDVCGPLFEQELAFWGVDELMMEPCCWGGYTQHRNAHKNLSMFDEMRDNEMGAEDEEDEEDFDEGGGDSNVPLKPLQNTGTKYKCWHMWIHYRPKLWSILEKPFSSVYSQVSAFISMMVILVSLGTFCAETVSYFENQKHIFQYLEYFYCAFFTLELLLRLCCCPSMKKYFLSLMTWIDIISTLQFYISFTTETNSLDFLFVSRLLRIFRLFRFFKNLSGMQVIAQTLKASANELLLLCIILLIPMIIFSTLVFYADAKEPSSNFSSIPGTFWWTIITMTTVGYGDVTPKSLMGKVIGAFCACSGVLIVALPVSVIGSNFNLYYSYAQARMKLPKRRSPALVSADKALVTSNNDKQPNTGGDTVINSLKGFASVMIDLNEMQPKSPTPATPAATATTPTATPVCSSPSTPLLRRDRSTRRHAIHVEPTVNHPVVGKKTDKKKKRKSRALSEITIDEEETALINNGSGGMDTPNESRNLVENYNNDNNNNNCGTAQEIPCTPDGRADISRASIGVPVSSSSSSSSNQLMNGTSTTTVNTNNDFENEDEYDESNFSSSFVTDPGLSKLQINSEDFDTPKISTRQRSISAPYNRKLTMSSLQEYGDPASPNDVYRKRTVIHMDLTQYKPKRIGKIEQKARHRKLTQVPICHLDGSTLNTVRDSLRLQNRDQEEETTQQPAWMQEAAENQEQSASLKTAESS